MFSSGGHLVYRATPGTFLFNYFKFSPAVLKEKLFKANSDMDGQMANKGRS